MQKDSEKSQIKAIEKSEIQEKIEESVTEACDELKSLREVIFEMANSRNELLNENSINTKSGIINHIDKRRQECERKRDTILELVNNIGEYLEQFKSTCENDDNWLHEIKKEVDWMASTLSKVIELEGKILSDVDEGIKLYKI